MSKYILIVEDSEDIAPLEIALLTLGGVTVKHFANGRAALDFLLGSPEDTVAVITDLNLPLMDGFDLVASMRAHRRSAHIPVIVLSGDGNPDTPERLRKLGVKAFFEKPYSPAIVRGTLETLLYVK